MGERLADVAEAVSPSPVGHAGHGRCEPAHPGSQVVQLDRQLIERRVHCLAEGAEAGGKAVAAVLGQAGVRKDEREHVRQCARSGRPFGPSGEMVSCGHV